MSILSPAGHDRIVPFRITDSKLVIRNEIGDYSYKERIRVWTLNDDDKSTTDILSAIRGGDKLRLVPAARFQGWQSYIREATIEVYGGLIPASTTRIVRQRTLDLLYTNHHLYTPLQEEVEEIRLLKLRRGRGGDEICCELVCSRLAGSELEPYEALSYCWGDSLDQRKIKLVHAGQALVEFVVTHNLHDALAFLRHADEDRLFWIDAICINQSDDDERAHQVALMRQIYSKARSVVVWLGSGSKDIAQVVDDINIVAKRHETARRADMTSADIFEMHHARRYQWWEWRDCILLSLDYFRRTWVLQEIYNAGHIDVHYGDRVLSWAAILRVNACIAAAKGVRPGAIVGMRPLLSGLFRLGRTGKSARPPSYARAHESKGILDVFIDALDLDASDPRDKIFALLSFEIETSDVSHLPQAIAPAYDKSIARVYADFTRWWIVRHKSLRILSAVHCSAGRTWQDLGYTAAFPIHHRASWSLWYDGFQRWADASLALLGKTPWYQASGGSKLDVDLLQSSQDPLILLLRGRRIGRIESIEVFPCLGQYAASTSSDSKASESSSESGRRPAENNDAITDEMFRAYELLLDPGNQFRWWAPGHPDDQQLGPAMSGSMAQHAGSHYNFYKQSRGLECHYPCVVRTAVGNSGLCPHSARKGDIIVTLNGGKVPYLLRPVDDKGNTAQGSGLEYTVIGNAFFGASWRAKLMATMMVALTVYLKRSFVWSEIAIERGLDLLLYGTFHKSLCL